MIQKVGQLIEYIKVCVSENGADQFTPIFIRQGIDGPMRPIEGVKMGRDARGLYIVLETSSSIIQQ